MNADVILLASWIKLRYCHRVQIDRSISCIASARQIRRVWDFLRHRRSQWRKLRTRETNKSQLEGRQKERKPEQQIRLPRPATAAMQPRIHKTHLMNRFR